MTILDKLAISLGRRDEVPNQELAKRIVDKRDKNAVKELVENLANKDKNVQSDCIKVLYEIGYQASVLIAPYAKEFVALPANKNNRLVWGAMIALDMLTPENPKLVFGALGNIMKAADGDSVIARDHAVGILIKLASMKQYVGKAFPLLIRQLKTCPTNQLPMYAENALPVISEKNKQAFAKTLLSRLGEVAKESKRKRIEKELKKSSSAKIAGAKSQQQMQFGRSG